MDGRGVADRRDLEPIEPSSAQQPYLDHRASQCSDITVQSHEYQLNYFVTWCADNSLDNMNDGRNLHEYHLRRKEERELSKIPMRTRMSTLRVLLNYCGSVEAVSSDLYNEVLVPQVSGEENSVTDIFVVHDRHRSVIDSVKPRPR